MTRAGSKLERHRAVIQGGIDTTSWFLGIYLADVLRFEFDWTADDWGRFTIRGMFAAATIAAIVQLLTGATTGLYRGRFRYGSFDEVANLVRAVMVTTIALAVVNRLNSQYFIPTSVVFIGGFIALMLMAGSRYVWRLLLDRRLRPNKDKGTPVLVFGAGEGGVQVVTSMQRNPESPYVPVALLDDNPAKSSLRVLGISVEGDRSSIAEAAKAHSAEMMVIAIPSAPPELLRELTDLALQAKLKVAVLPPLSEMFGAVIGISDIRPVTEADLLGRHVINTDIESIAGYITGKRVLVTGAGGSIGSELCHQLAKFAPDKLVMLDRDESALHGVQMLIEGRALLDDPNLVVCDIRDADRVLEVFKLHQPQVVFHTAALKHLPLLQLHPGEAVKTNVHGTENLLTVATACGVERFVNISTDKAADPTSVLGYSKRIAERLTAASSADTDGNYLSVRFGNVLGSRGSVLTAFRAQVDAGGPITVTDPEVTRFFMTVEEAVELVIQAGAVGRAGEALVFDMGEPVKIDDVARRFAATAERPVEIVYTGLRSGEKLHEVLLGEGEIDQRPAHPLIAHVTVPPLKIGAVAATVGDAGGDELIALLKALAYGSHETPDAGAAQEQPAAAPETDA